MLLFLTFFCLSFTLGTILAAAHAGSTPATIFCDICDCEREIVALLCAL